MKELQRPFAPSSLATRPLRFRNVARVAKRLTALASLLAVAMGAVAGGCGGDIVSLGERPVDGGAPPERPSELVPATKVDILFVVDNSSGMADKQAVLAKSLPPFLDRFVRPRCIDPTNGFDLGASTNGACTNGVVAHAPVRDLHVGVISSSLGTVAPDGDRICDPRNGRPDDRARLSNLDGDGNVVPRAARGFLEVSTSGPIDEATRETLLADATALVTGVGETGCGLEAQLESMYRFLAEPDPAAAITVGANSLATRNLVDATILSQRKAFLRPDSALVVVMITDEDDATIDPFSIGGQGWSFGARHFPGSRVTRADGSSSTAPRGTSACATTPLATDADGAALCTSCGFQSVCDPEAAFCQRIQNDPNCQMVADGAGGSGDGYAGYYGPNDDSLNVRFHRMKQRFGVDPQYPIARYVRALSRTKVPNGTTDHSGPTSYGPGAYADVETCTNPIFAAELPEPTGDLCNLPVGSRSERLVFFGLIAGIAPSLVPGYAQGQSPDWVSLVGASPDTFDESGIDPHMIASTKPRAGLPAASSTRGDNGSDPNHGREWNTNEDGLQFACTFALEAPRACSPTDGGCLCGKGDTNPPLCGATGSIQTRAGATPSLRPLRLAKALGEQSVIASVCPSTTDVASPDYGYRVGLDALASRVGKVLAK